MRNLNLTVQHLNRCYALDAKHTQKLSFLECAAQVRAERLKHKAQEKIQDKNFS